MKSMPLHPFSGWLLLATAAISTSLGPTAAMAVDVPATQPVSGKISWIYDYQQGKLTSSETGKPMFVVFRCER